MNEEEIEVLSNSDDLNELSKILERFLSINENAFTFPFLLENNKRVILWAALFQHLQKKTSEDIHNLCLAVVRVLSRDKAELDNLICEKWITTLVDRSGLYNFIGEGDQETVLFEMPRKDIVLEALKCLCNITFNSEVARALCAHTSIAQGLIARLRTYKDIPFRDEIMLFDMKLLFILTALRQDIRAKVKDELHGVDYLICGLNELLLEASSQEAESETASACSSVAGEYQGCYLKDDKRGIVCEILKTQFNLMKEEEESIGERDEAMYLKLMPVLAALLYARASSEEKLMDLHSNIANLLTSIPPMFYSYLTPELGEGEVCQCEYDGRNMDAMQALVQLLQYRLENSMDTKNQYENLSPILTVMVKSARSSRHARKYLRRVVLPPLRDVSRPPEHGRALRNLLCRLLTTPHTALRDLVAEFLFVLCKEKVGRMVKYTGFGNAAGHLAQKGLLGAPRGALYSSSSDDSDTEEYRSAAPHIDPVLGCTRPKRQDPFEGMTLEQKEHEAMKLVNLFDKMLADGVMKPARIGPDGRPQPVDHVLEFRDHVPTRPQS